jgi:hypothetical protein
MGALETRPTPTNQDSTSRFHTQKKHLAVVSEHKHALSCLNCPQLAHLIVIDFIMFNLFNFDFTRRTDMVTRLIFNSTSTWPASAYAFVPVLSVHVFCKVISHAWKLVGTCPNNTKLSSWLVFTLVYYRDLISDIIHANMLELCDDQNHKTSLLFLFFTVYVWYCGVW